MDRNLTIMLGVCVVGACFGLAIALRSLFRHWRMRVLVRSALCHSIADKTQEALGLLVRADSLWSFDIVSGSRKATLRTIDELEHIWQEILKGCNALSIPQNTSAVFHATQALRRLFLDDESFRFDGRSMKPKAAVEFSRLVRELDCNRRSVGATVLEAIKEKKTSDM